MGICQSQVVRPHLQAFAVLPLFVTFGEDVHHAALLVAARAAHALDAADWGRPGVEADDQVDLINAQRPSTKSFC